MLHFLEGKHMHKSLVLSSGLPEDIEYQGLGRTSLSQLNRWDSLIFCSLALHLVMLTVPCELIVFVQLSWPHLSIPWHSRRILMPPVAAVYAVTPVVYAVPCNGLFFCTFILISGFLQLPCYHHWLSLRYQPLLSSVTSLCCHFVTSIANHRQSLVAVLPGSSSLLTLEDSHDALLFPIAGCSPSLLQPIHTTHCGPTAHGSLPSQHLLLALSDLRFCICG
ncbi:hypothetical protein Pelo_7156 [Pelomyxa schiedti]|nr:hypothetical protein Pelo_7156 [Pelomyxa schiedti]